MRNLKTLYDSRAQARQNVARGVNGWFPQSTIVYGPELPPMPRPNKRDAKVIARLEQGWLIFWLKKGHKPVIVLQGNGYHANIRVATIERLQAQGLIVAMGPHAYRMVKVQTAPIPTTNAKLLALGAEAAVARNERMEDAA